MPLFIQLAGNVNLPVTAQWQWSVDAAFHINVRFGSFIKLFLRSSPCYLLTSTWPCYTLLETFLLSFIYVCSSSFQRGQSQWLASWLLYPSNCGIIISVSITLYAINCNKTQTKMSANLSNLLKYVYSCDCGLLVFIAGLWNYS